MQRPGRKCGSGWAKQRRVRITQNVRAAICAAMVLLIAGRPLPAAATSSAWSMQPDGHDRYTLEAGGTATGTFRLSAPADHGQTLTLYGADMEAAAGGGFAPAQASQAMRGVGAWLQLPQNTITLAAGSQSRVPFTVAVPKGTTPGLYDGAIVALAATGRQTAGFTTSTRAALTIAVLVPAISVGVAAAGQLLAAPAGAWSLSIPPGAFAGHVSISVTPTAGAPVPLLPPPPAGAVTVVPPLVLAARDENGQAILEPGLPLRLRLQVPSGATADGLFVFSFDPALHAWLPLRTTVRGGTARAAIDRLSAVAVFSAPALVPFRDLAGHWALPSVLALQSLGLVSGYPDGSFRPEAAVTRAEFAQLLAQGLRPPAANASVLAGFADATSLAPWAVPPLAALVAAGWMRAGPGGRLEPQGQITRAEAAVILARALQLPAATALPFTDAGQVPAWATPEVGAAAAAGLLRGYPDGTFGPWRMVRRAQAAVLLLRALRYRNR